MQLHAFGPDDAALRGRFFQLGEALLAADPSRGWVDPQGLRREVQASYLGPQALRLFLAEDLGAPQARCAAIVNPALQDDAGRPIGLVGYFEAREHEAGARAVLDAAAEWLRGQGCPTVWGPMDCSIWHRYRLMTHGFETDPFLGEPRNPAWYPPLFQAAGWQPRARWYSWDLQPAHLDAMHMFAMSKRQAGITQAGYRYHPFRLEAFDEELTRVHAVLSEGFRENLGFTPLPLEEFRALFGPMRAVLIPELAPLVTGPDGRTIGFGYVFPDLAAAMTRARAAGKPLDALTLREHPPERLVFHTMVSLASERGKGLVDWGLAELMDHVAALGFRRAVGALAKEGPTIYTKTGLPSREYTLFARSA